MNAPFTLTWLEPGMAFPDAASAWPVGSPAPGLLAAGGALDIASLHNAYQHGIFPWYNEGQPILWWCPDPRMVLDVAQFRLHRSLRKTLQKFRSCTDHIVRFDSAFDQVTDACAHSARRGPPGTWIQPEMRDAYSDLHRAGYAHSVETWIDGELVGGLYCVAIGHAVFGESMFTRRSDASKTALAALVAFCRQHHVKRIDCQQNTAHLASLGAQEIPRSTFLRHIAETTQETPLHWHFDPLYWNHLLTS